MQHVERLLVRLLPPWFWAPSIASLRRSAHCAGNSEDSCACMQGIAHINGNDWPEASQGERARGYGEHHEKMQA